MGKAKENILGQRFGKLIVIGPVESAGRTAWLCQCDCGKIKEIKTGYLKSGRTRSCGCIRTGNAGRSKERPEYSCWLSMRSRCNSKNNSAYKNYGGRGIIVCDEWKHFENFLRDVGPRPSPSYSIDRINVNGNYEPGNVRWIIAKEQNKNKRNSVNIEYNGEVHCIAEWARIKNITVPTLTRRYHAGWSIDEKIFKPSKTNYHARTKPERVKKKASFYSRKNTYSLNRSQDDFTFEEWEEILKESSGKCYYCHENKKLSIDHVVSIKNGGFDTKENIVAACISCNSSKRDRCAPRQLHEMNNGKGAKTENVGTYGTYA